MTNFQTAGVYLAVTVILSFQSFIIENAPQFSKYSHSKLLHNNPGKTMLDKSSSSIAY